MENLRMSNQRSWRGTGRNESQFLWRRNLKGRDNVRVVNVGLSLFLFLFLLYIFIFIFI